MNLTWWYSFLVRTLCPSTSNTTLSSKNRELKSTRWCKRKDDNHLRSDDDSWRLSSFERSSLTNDVRYMTHLLYLKLSHTFWIILTKNISETDLRSASVWTKNRIRPFFQSLHRIPWICSWKSLFVTSSSWLVVHDILIQRSWSVQTCRTRFKSYDNLSHEFKFSVGTFYSSSVLWSSYPESRWLISLSSRSYLENKWNVSESYVLVIELRLDDT